MATDKERREAAESMREHGNEYLSFYGAFIGEAIGITCGSDKELWHRLADLIEPAPESSGAAMKCDRDALLDLADRMEGYARFCKERSIQVGNNLVECYALRIREAVNACEGDSDTPAARDKAEAADAHYDDCDDVEGHHIIDVSDKFNENIAAIDFVRDNGGLEAVKARLVPEGMEWPRFEDGEPVRIGDEVQSFNKGQTSHITSITFNKTGVHAGYRWCGKDDYTTVSAKALKRPAKVLDADGVEIRVVDTLYYVDGREQCVNTVARLTDDGCVQFGKINEAGYVTYCDAACIPPNQLTHRAPVIAADGEPLEVGQTVWTVDAGIKFEVHSIEGDTVWGSIDGDRTDDGLDPKSLTHQRPESKCRDCAHWQKDPTADNMGVCWFYYHEHEGQDCYPARRADIGACEEFMPRAKALAGVSE